MESEDFAQLLEVDGSKQAVHVVRVEGGVHWRQHREGPRAGQRARHPRGFEQCGEEQEVGVGVGELYDVH